MDNGGNTQILNDPSEKELALEPFNAFLNELFRVNKSLDECPSLLDKMSLKREFTGYTTQFFNKTDKRIRYKNMHEDYHVHQLGALGNATTFYNLSKVYEGKKPNLSSLLKYAGDTWLRFT